MRNASRPFSTLPVIVSKHDNWKDLVNILNNGRVTSEQLQDFHGGRVENRSYHQHELVQPSTTSISLRSLFARHPKLLLVRGECEESDDGVSGGWWHPGEFRTVLG